ncbi:MAG: ATP-dependent sacrificial sulfur transferase LarE [Nitrososphaera sp.]|nr:ATP-dependent sacrificial sulfur transferase LarE [Nitrososphaera sp.]MCI0708086.1 ATP-dependent sacrificial sulfur transferase LarE [Ignavibacteriota bacterium]
MLNNDLHIKYLSLQSILREMGSAAIGFSGGIDSTLLVRAATDVLGDNALAVIGRSETYPTREFEEAIALAESFGSRYRVVNTEETDDLKFKENPPDRCYFCKNELFGKLGGIAQEEGIRWIADGTITDDLGDFRPGMRAKSENNVRSPLLEAGLSKDDVRLIAQHLNIPTWDKPSFACLASRFPYGFGITKENLMKIDAAETFLRDHGFRFFRVRHHDDKTARIELGKQDFHRVFDDNFRAELVAHFKGIGYHYVTLDLQGFRSGSMNETLTTEQKEEYLKVK